MSNKYIAQTIRAELKARYGYTSKQVSVTSRGSIDVDIKDPSIPLKQVADFAKRFEQIDRCPATGEVLGGGNTYVFVGYSIDAQKALIERYVPAIMKAIEDTPPRCNMPIDGLDATIGTDHSGNLIVRCGNRSTLVANAHQAAREIMQAL